jgi:hypothetical protein
VKGRKDKAKKKSKPPLGRRVGARLRSVGVVGADAVRNPRGIPQTAHGAFRRWMRKVWDVRGGGLYALGYALTFAWLEMASLVTSVSGASSLIGFLREELIEFLFRCLGDSLVNLIEALIWPVFVIGFNPPWGALALGAAFALFPYTLKPLVERWLFADEAPADSPTDPG